MTGQKTEKRFEVWGVPEFALAIEYTPPTLEEIRLYALSRLKSLSRGSTEVGGVLFGSRGAQMVRILTWRPIACEQAKGSVEAASRSERLSLVEILENAKTDPELTGMHAVGWFVSHPKGAIRLTASDLKVYDHYFPWSWQITLVLAPSRESTRAGFFFRNSEGSVQTDASRKEFELPALSPGAEIPREPPIAPEPPPPPRAPAVPVATPEKQPELRLPDLKQRSLFSDRRLWIWAAPLLLAMIVGAMLIERPKVPGSSPPLGLHVNDTGGQVHLEWNRNAPVIRESVRGDLAIRDGANTAPLHLPLEGDRLRDGNFIYARKSGDLEVKLTVYPARGKPVEESARFVGDPPDSANPDLARLRQERDNATAEVERLREALLKESNRNHQLEETLRILQNRLEVEELRRRK